MEEYMADNTTERIIESGDSAAAVEETTAIQDTEISEETEINTSESSENNSPAEAANVGEEDKITKTKAFSQRLNEMSSKKLDSFIASMGWKNDYLGGKPIRTEAEYKEFLQMHSAAQAGRDPVSAARINRLESEVSSYRIEKQDAAMQNDPVFGELYKEYRNDVLSLVENAHRKGLNVDIQGAFNAIVMQGENFKNILARSNTNAEKRAIEKIKNNGVSAVGSLSAESNNKPLDIASMSSEDFEKLVKRVTNGEKLRL